MGIKEVRSTMDVFTVMWLPTNKCTYDCYYCLDVDRGVQHEKGATWDQTKDFFEEIFEHYTKLGFKNYSIGISGGEPTVFSKLPEACEYLKSKKKEGLEIVIMLNTNLYRSKKWMSDIVDNVDSIGVSYHIDQVDQDEFLEKIKFLEGRVGLSIRLMLNKERFWDVVNFGKRLMDRPGMYMLDYAPIFEVESMREVMYDYDDEEKQRFINENSFVENYRLKFPVKRDLFDWYHEVVYKNGTTERMNASDIVSKRLNSFEEWECDIGKTSLQFSYNGEMYTAGCGVQRLGNWLTDDYELPTEGVICPRKVCFCGFDIMVPKRKKTWI